MKRKVSILVFVVLGVVALVTGTAVATGFFRSNNTDPSVKDAAAIVGVEQLIGNYS